MHVSLTAVLTPSHGQCACCKQHRAVIALSVTVEGRAGTLEPICLECLVTGERTGDIPLEELSPGAVPRRKALRHNKRASYKQEVSLAGELGGRVQPGSGNQKHAKGDLRKDGIFRLEAKLTHSDSFSLKLDELLKIQSECDGQERPVFVVDFLKKGTGQLRDRFAVIAFDHLKELLDGARKHR